jgi:hypothetical protein
MFNALSYVNFTLPCEKEQPNARNLTRDRIKVPTAKTLLLLPHAPKSRSLSIPLGLADQDVILDCCWIVLQLSRILVRQILIEQ